MRTGFAKLLKKIKKDHPDSSVELLRHAYRVADKAHQQQKRLSGEPYISHCLAVAAHLESLGMDLVTVSAGMLHDVLEDTDVGLADLEREFGEDIARLVDGVTKIGAMPATDAHTSPEHIHAENLRKMLIATAKDVRVILIKLADRLHNIQTIQYLPPEKIERICKETRDIYVPIANRLGLSQWKWELEDHVFHHLHPGEYKEMARLVAMKRREREEELRRIIGDLERRLKEAEVSAHVIGRPKHLYSIYTKMVRQGKTFEQVLDLQAIRIVTQTVAGCYNALGVVHQVWRPIPGRFKDYIAGPKVNLYQSIHTSVMMDDGRPLEFQIRTDEMDRTAREGIAAHWKYKDEIDQPDSTSEKQLTWLKQMYDWLEDAQAPDELFDSLRRDISTHAVFVNTPKGDVLEFPAGATPLDFAYRVHSAVGHHCIGARVNGSMVPLRYHLQTGDTVEILTSKNQTPHVDWLEIVVTGRARTRIRQKMRELKQLPSLEETGANGATRKTAARPQQPARRTAKVQEVDDATRDKLIRIEGQKGMAVRFAKCCNPMPGHPIIGYITTRTGITIHRAECSHLARKSGDGNDRMVGVSWEGDEAVEAAMQVTIGARPNVLADITGAMRPMNIEISHAEYRPGDASDSVFVFVFTATDEDTVARVRRTLLSVPGVINVSLMPGATPRKVTQAR